MKELTNKKIVKSCDLLEVVKEIFVFSLYIFIIVFYYYIWVRIVRIGHAGSDGA